MYAFGAKMLSTALSERTQKSVKIFRGIQLSETSVSCAYCDGVATLRYRNLRHPVWHAVGKVDLYSCRRCGSLTTWPLPSKDLLERCYAQYGKEGYPENKARAKKDSSQLQWYQDIVQHFAVPSLANLRVADAGAGEGLLTRVLLTDLDAGGVDAFDFHPCPADLQESVSNGKLVWRRTDLNAENWAGGNEYDAVFCTSVIEHVRNPLGLIRNLCGICKPGGHIYVLGPCVDALAYQLLGARWPYMIPGEHLSVPSRNGLERMCARLQQPRVQVRSIPVSYSLKYLVGALFRIPVPKALDLVVKLPLGAFTLDITKQTAAESCPYDNLRIAHESTL
jgi:SAM-dependent methyltransferase